MASVDVYQNRPTGEESPRTMAINIRSIAISSKSNNLPGSGRPNVDKLDALGGIEGKPRNKRTPSLSLQIKPSLSPTSGPQVRGSSPTAGNTTTNRASTDPPSLSNNSSPNSVTKFHTTHSPRSSPTTEVKSTKSDRASTEPPSISSTSSSSGVTKVSPTHSTRSSSQPPSEPRPHSPIAVRQFLANKIFSHQQREMLADGKTLISNGGNVSPNSPILTSKTPNNSLPSPAMPRNVTLDGSKDGSRSPQSPLLVRKFISAVIDGELKKGETSTRNGHVEEMKPSSDKKAVEELIVEDIEDRSVADVNQATIVNGESTHLGRASTEKVSSDPPKPISSLVEKVQRDYSVPTTSGTTLSSQRSLSESNILENSDKTDEPDQKPAQSTSHRTLSSPDLDASVEQGNKEARREVSSSPAGSPSTRSRFSAWFKKGSKQKTPEGSVSPRHVSESPKRNSRSTSPGNTGKITPMEDSDGLNSKSPIGNEEKKSRGLSEKLQSWLKKDGRRERSSSLHREDALDLGPESSTPQLTGYTRISPEKTENEPVVPELLNGVGDITENGDDVPGNTSSDKTIGPTAKVVKVPGASTTSVPVQRGRRGSMYEARPLPLTRVKSPAVSDSSRTSSPTKKPSVKTGSKTTSVSTKADKKVTDKKTTDKPAKSTKVGATSKHISTASKSSVGMRRTGSGSSVASQKSVGSDSLKSASVTSLKASSTTSLASRTSASSPIHGKTSPLKRPSSATSNASLNSGKSTPSRTSKSTSSLKQTSTQNKPKSPSLNATSTQSKSKSPSKTTTTPTKKLSAGSSIKNVLRPSSSTKTRSKSEGMLLDKKIKQSPVPSAPKTQKSKSSTMAPVKSKVASNTSHTAAAKSTTVSAKKPPSGFFRRRQSYAIAMGEEQASTKSVEPPPNDKESELGPKPVPLVSKPVLEEEEPAVDTVPVVHDALRRRHISENSFLDSVIEEEDEMLDSPVVSPRRTHRKSAPEMALRTHQKVIERSVGNTGRRRSIVTVVPSQPIQRPTPTKTTPKAPAGTRRYSLMPTTKSSTMDRNVAKRRQSTTDMFAMNKSATLGARGRRQSAYERKPAEPTPTEDESQTKSTLRRRKSSLEGIKDFLTNKVSRRRRSSSEGPQDGVPGAKPKKSDSGSTLAEFEEIGSTTSRLTHQDHKRTVRPKLRRPPSTGHLRSLMDRDDVSSDIKPNTKVPRRANTMDSNAWSTYMGKKQMDPRAEAGLALKLDLNSVKLRKTVSMTIAEGGSMEGVEGVNLGNVVEYSNPPVLLLHIKGRKRVQTVVVEPDGASLNSGDVFILVTAKDLFHWIGSKANIMEKAKGTEIVERIMKKKELGCKAVYSVTLEDQKSERKASVFWECLGGKQKPKAADQGFKDEEYEKNIPASTIVYELTGEGDQTTFTVMRENVKQMPTISMLDSTKILVFDFVTEVYLWIGKQSKITLRKRAQILARELFDDGCFPSSFQRRPSSARRNSRSSIRLRRSSKGELRSSMGKSKKTSKGIAASVTGASGADRVKKTRPKWAIFNRLNEGSETILFREKFSDWPDPTRIIKMKGHVSSGETTEIGPMPDPVPMDPKVFLNPQEPFRGLVLEGENVHRGKGRMRPDDVRGSKVTTIALKKWLIKEYDHSLMSEDEVGVFHCAEGYVIRWGFRAGILRRLEGIHRGNSVSDHTSSSKRPVTWHVENAKSLPDLLELGGVGEKDPFAEDSDDEQDKNQGPVIEGGGSERCAYFFWQGKDSSITEKGAAALMTVELDEERGPQVRVPQGEEVPAFLNLFNGGMIVLDGKAETNPLHISPKLKPCRLFAVRGQTKSEACLIEVPWSRTGDMSSQLRSRGCYVLHHLADNVIYLWYGSKSTTTLQKAAKRAVVGLRKMFQESKVNLLSEGSESDEFWNLLNGKEYISLLNVSRSLDYSPRMWQLTSSTGEFVANEILCPTRSGELEAFPFLQTDLYSSEQPALFMLDVHYDIFVWVGWWPVQTDVRFREKNQFTGDAIVRFTRDKRLALQTALNYAKACERIREPKVHVVLAGYEHEKFANHFPYWSHDPSIALCNKQHVTIRSPHSLDAAEELKKLSRDQYSLAELQKKPLPEGVDPKKLESYLSEEEFNNVFKMSKSDFTKLPLWKKTSLKKDAGLF